MKVLRVIGIGVRSLIVAAMSIAIVLVNIWAFARFGLVAGIFASFIAIGVLGVVVSLGAAILGTLVLGPVWVVRKLVRHERDSGGTGTTAVSLPRSHDQGTAAETEKRHGKRHRVIAAVLAVGLVMVAGAGVGFWRQASQQRTKAITSPPGGTAPQEAKSGGVSPTANSSPTAEMKQYWADLEDGYWHFQNETAWVYVSYFKHLAVALQTGDVNAARNALTTLRANATLIVMQKNVWDKRIYPGESLSQLHQTYTSVLTYYASLAQTAERLLTTAEFTQADLTHLQGVMTKWVVAMDLVNSVLDEEKATAKATGLPYDPTLEYFRTYDLAGTAAAKGPVMSIANRLATSFSKHSDASDRQGLLADFAFFNQQMADFNKVYDQWATRPSPGGSFTRLHMLLLQALATGKAASQKAENAYDAQDFAAFVPAVYEFADRCMAKLNLVETEQAQLAKQLHLISLN